MIHDAELFTVGPDEVVVTFRTDDAREVATRVGDHAVVTTGPYHAARVTGLEPEATAADLTDAAYAALDRWQRHTVNPMFSRTTTDACRAVVRSCEGILAGLA